MLKCVNEIKDVPAAIGPYSQAVWTGDYLFVSGQVPIDPATGRLVEGGIAEQTDQVLTNIRALLKSQGLDYANVAKATVFLTDLSSFQTVNQIYARHLEDNKPARATVQVAALPLGALIEIEVVAYRTAQAQSF